MKTVSALALATLLAAACTKNDAAPAPASPAIPEAEPMAQPTPEPQPDPAQAEADAAAQAEAEAKRANAERVAAARQELEAEAATEAARWNDELHKKATALRNRKFRSAKQALPAILASEHREPAHRERDAYRHPLKTLLFFGIQPSWTVVELGTGGGWYTEILAPLVAGKGKLIAVSYDAEGPADSMRTVYGMRLGLFLAKSPELYGDVQVVAIDPPNRLDLGVEGTADAVLAIREMHNWYRSGAMDAYLAAVHTALKDGGVLGVVQHRAAAGSSPDDSAKSGYLPEAWLVETVEAAGFKLAGKSEINANPKDTKDYESGVWTLPPNYALGETDKDKYTAIGESDRMTLKFVKVPAAQASAAAQ